MQIQAVSARPGLLLGNLNALFECGGIMGANLRTDALEGVTILPPRVVLGLALKTRPRPAASEEDALI